MLDLKAMFIKSLTTEDILAALNKLPEQERDRINIMANDLVKKISAINGERQKGRDPHSRSKVMFGYYSALELLAKLGIWSINNPEGKTL
jgi:hypothetical protein